MKADLPLSYVRLQWGRAFSDAEMSALRAAIRGGYLLQWGRAFSDAEITYHIEDIAPYKKLQWGRAFSDAEIRLALRQNPAATPLQWGRAFSDAEMRPWRVLPAGRKAASMGPRLFRRGNGNSIVITSRCILASMGPRLFRRGNAGKPRPCRRPPPSFNGAAPFQTRKSRAGTEIKPLRVMLQWGRAFSDAEIMRLNLTRKTT